MTLPEGWFKLIWNIPKKILWILRNIFLSPDKKDFVKKEIKAVTEKLTVLNRFEEKVKKIEEFYQCFEQLWQNS